MSDMGGRSSVLTPNYPPLNFAETYSWSDQFEYLLAKSTSVNVVTGYASEDSLVEILAILENMKVAGDAISEFNLIIGMAFFDGLTERQKEAILDLKNFLEGSLLGSVFIPTKIAVHSKCSYFEGAFGRRAIIGSTNFSALIKKRQSELDVEFCETDPEIDSVKSYVETLISQSEKVSAPLLKAIQSVKTSNSKLIKSIHAKPYSPESLEFGESGLHFHLPIKAEIKSNLNKFNAAPRGNVPRSWYEVELIVPTSVQRMSGFPNKVDGTDKFRVFTDDGFTFECHVSGGQAPLSNKNFESSSDLKLLGYWLKEKLVSSGVLNEGDLLTQEHIDKYGRNHLTMTALVAKNSWYIDFGRK